MPSDAEMALSNCTVLEARVCQQFVLTGSRLGTNDAIWVGVGLGLVDVVDSDLGLLLVIPGAM